MSQRISRRDVIKQIGRGTAALALTGGNVGAQGADIVVAGRPVEIAIETVSAATVRITLLPIERGQALPLPDTGTLIQTHWRAAGRGRAAASLRSVRSGSH